MQITFASATLVAMFIFFGCSEESGPYTCQDCIQTPEANELNNNSGKGIYKGIVVGSLKPFPTGLGGTIQFNIANNDETLSATLTYDGHVYELTTLGVYSSETGFDGTFFNNRGTEDEEDDIKIGFSCNNDGTQYSAFYGYYAGPIQARVEIWKELSHAMVVVFEGTNSGDNPGTLNVVVLKNTIDNNGYGYCSGYSMPDAHHGTFTSFVGNVKPDGTIYTTELSTNQLSGAIVGDNVKGTWGNSDGSGSWKAKRTL